MLLVIMFFAKWIKTVEKTVVVVVGAAAAAAKWRRYIG